MRENVQIFVTEDEVQEYYEQDKENNQVVLFEGVVYDVKEYMPSHPGGADYIADNLGKNINEEFYEAEHTKFARKIFNDLPVRGKMEPSKLTDGLSAKKAQVDKNPSGCVVHKEFVSPELREKIVRRDDFDYSIGLVQQLWVKNWEYDEYMQYINTPKHFVNPVRDLKLFENIVLETLTKCTWWQLLLFWSIYIFTWVPYLGENRLINCIVMPICVYGFFLVEYMMHRFIFHGENKWLQMYPDKQFLFKIHFGLHGVHHAFPQDKQRGVMPPFLGYWYFQVFLRYPIQYLLPSHVFPAAYIGFLTGYLMYDLTHYYFHHGVPPEGSYFKFMKSYHTQHHYKNGELGYGVTCKLWDKVFDTEVKYDKQE